MNTRKPRVSGMNSFTSSTRGAASWPLSQNMGRLLSSMAPQGLDIAERLKPAFDRAVQDGSRDRTATDRYDARRDEDADGLVEKSR